MPGSEQSAPRAELFAALWALRHAGGPLTLVSDCEGLVKGWAQQQQQLQQPRRGPLADIWREIDRCRNELHFHASVRWVPGHTGHDDVQAGRVQQCDSDGSRLADQLAKAGATVHAVSRETARWVERVDDMAGRMLRLLVCILGRCMMTDPRGQDGRCAGGRGRMEQPSSRRRPRPVPLLPAGPSVLDLLMRRGRPSTSNEAADDGAHEVGRPPGVVSLLGGAAPGAVMGSGILDERRSGEPEAPV